MDHDEFVNRLSKFLTIRNHSQAEHSGYHHIEFTATEYQLRKLLKANRFFNIHVAVHLTEKEEIVYSIHVSNGNVICNLINYLEGVDYQLYTELLYMDVERREKILEKLTKGEFHGV